MATLKQRLHRKNGTTYDTIHLETNATVVKMSTTDSTTVSSKLTTMNSSISSLNTEMSSLKSSVSSGKAQIASAITDKGVSTSASDSFSQMATNISQIKGGISGVPVYGTDFTYTGNYQVVNDGNDNWRIKFLSSGVFKPLTDMQIDCFLVGGGGSSYGQAGGGGGYTTTSKNIILYANTSYSISIGEGGMETGTIYSNNVYNVGGTSTAFNQQALGGKYGKPNSASKYGGDGGSGGAGYNSQGIAGNGGSDGGNGGMYGGTGQGTTTREFGSSVATLYAGGGGSYTSKDGKDNGVGGTGGGGNGGKSGKTNTGGGSGGRVSLTTASTLSGGSGIVIIRNSQ